MHGTDSWPGHLFRTRRAVLGAGLGAGLGLAAAAVLTAGHPARAAGSREIRIGYQRYGTLIILKHTGMLEKALPPGVSVSWAEFPAGPQMLQAMQAGALDLGITGDAPPIFAQAASDRVMYVGQEPKAPRGEAIIVREASPIRSMADLKGRSVGLNRASNVHWLLLAALKHAGMSVADIRPVFLPPAAARPAFSAGQIDAWAIWDPYLSAAESEPVRRIAEAGGLVGNRQFILGDRQFLQRSPDLASLVLAQLAKSDAWAQDHKPEVSAFLAADTGLPLPVVSRAVDRLSFGVVPISPDVVAEQQAAADAFLAQGLLPAKLTVADAVWHAPAATG
ncbi:MAG: aliphatic sulfonate ABC transporter substrate-binding protein [Gluconacetobacter diazotrophicus]|nr:aliphatic sulfonate ABC transporter substrate-binding protein [Gluconacetobacter diazotrophicus]